MTGRENAAAKASRYLVEGRLVVRHVDDDGVVAASCRGDGAIYRLGRDRHGCWHCDCPAHGRCCHLLALGLVVAPGGAS